MTSYAGGGSGGSLDHVDTRVEGSPGELRAQARWLRGSLAGDLDDAGERQAAARNAASAGWEGEAGAAYGEVGRLALRVIDDHADRTRRAAEVVDDVADRLAALRATMADLRDEARVGGLVVVGTTVSMPVAHAPGPDLLLNQVPGVLAQRRSLLRRIAGDVARARSDHAAWLDRRLARAQVDAAERGDLDGALSRMTGSEPGASGASPGAGPGSPGGAAPSGTALAGGGVGAAAPVAGPPGSASASGAGGGALVGSASPLSPGRDDAGRAAGGSAAAPWAPRGNAQPAPWAPVGEQEPAPWAPVCEQEPAPWLLGSDHDEAPWSERTAAR